LNYVIIGSSAAAIGAIEAIRSLDQKSAITVVSREQEEYIYSRPLIAHYIARRTSDDEMLYRPPDFFVQNNVEYKPGVTVTGIDTVAGQLITDKGFLAYDRLLITTGSKITNPAIKGEDLQGVYSFQTYAQARSIRQKLKEGTKAVVIGAGLIGLRAAYGLEEGGAQVTIIELLPRILNRVLDVNGSAMIKKVLQEGGIKVYTGCSVAEMTGENGVLTGIILDNGEKLEAEIAIIATGVTPDLDALKNSDIKINNGIVVNKHFQTNYADIFAAGDVAETYDISRNRSMVNANWPNAYEQGHLAGLNLAGRMIPYEGSLGMNSVSFFGVPVVSLGLFDPHSDGVDDAEIKERLIPQHNIYQKIVFRDNKLKGAIFIGDLAYCGAIKDLIKSQTLVGIIKDSILEEKYQFSAFLRKKRYKDLEGRFIDWPQTHSSGQRYEKSFNEESWTERERDKRNWQKNGEGVK